MTRFFNQNKYSIAVCIISILVAWLYFMYISNYVTDKIWDTSTTFISTLLSIIIGVTISIILYNYQNNQQDIEKIKELKTNLTAELSDLNRVMSSGEAMNVNQLDFVVTFIQPIIIDECSKSGLFNPLEVENFLHVSRKIKFYNVQVSYFLNLINNASTVNFNTLLVHCHKNMETSRIAVINDIVFLAKKLNLELSDSITCK